MDKLKLETLRLWVGDLEAGEIAQIPTEQLWHLLSECDFKLYEQAALREDAANRKAYEFGIAKAKAGIPPHTETVKDYLKELAGKCNKATEIEKRVSEASDTPPNGGHTFGWVSRTRKSQIAFRDAAMEWAQNWEDRFTPDDLASLVRPGDLSNGRLRVVTPNGFRSLNVRALVADNPENYVSLPPSKYRERALSFLKGLLQRETGAP